MIDLYTYGTPNGQRVSIMLEAVTLPYRAHKVDLAKGEQHAAEFQRINPAGQIPVIVDHNGPGSHPVTLTQSAAILHYLAEKSRRFLPAEGAKRAAVLEAFSLVMTDVAPASASIFYIGQMADPPLPEVIAHVTGRFVTLLTQVDRRLAKSEWLGGHDISIADLALYPTVAARKAVLDDAPGLSDLRRWASAMALRPDVMRGMSVPE